jgi:uroporphyrinogen-III synthase
MAFKILHTASREEPLSSLLQCAGFKVQYVPLFTYQDLIPASPSYHFTYCIVSSQRSVRYIENNIELFRNKRFYVVGDKTKVSIERLGFDIEYISTDGVATILHRMDGCIEFGVFIGAKNPTLRLQNWINDNPNCIHLEVYQQNRIEYTELLSVQVDAIVITSSNGVRYLSKLIENRDIPIISIGNTSKQTALECGFVNVITSDTPTYESIVVAVQKLFTS